jgi:cell wall-associated NlpC family hydrolase
MTVTISNTNQIRQYHLPRHFRIFVWIGFALLLTVVSSTGYYIASLHTRLSKQTSHTLIQKMPLISTPIPPKPVLPKPLLTKPLSSEKPTINRMLTARITQLEAQVQRLRNAEPKQDHGQNTDATPQASSLLPSAVGMNDLEDPLVGMLLSKQARQYHLFSPFLSHVVPSNQYAAFNQAKPVAAPMKHPSIVRRKTLFAATYAQKPRMQTRTYGTNAAERKIESFFQRKNHPVLSKIAIDQLGKHYVWGAVGPRTFDCSGFTSYVYRKLGVNIPRTSRLQAKFGKLIRYNQLRPGDLVFFDTSRRRQGSVNHVGIYLGSNKFIHASSARHKVVITSLSKTFYRKRFKWARRIN